MISVNCKIRDIKCREEDKYRFITNLDSDIFLDNFLSSSSYEDYDPENILEEDEVFQIKKFSETENFFGDIIIKSGSVDLNTIKKSEMRNISYIYYKTTINNNDYIVFQKITKSKYLEKIKHLAIIEGNVLYKESEDILILNDEPDAIYDIGNDRILFKKLERLIDFCPGIVQLFRTATEQETVEFINNEFINLLDNFNSEDVGKQNRKRIALVKQLWDNFNEVQKKDIIRYTGLYCSADVFKDEKFSIRKDSDLKEVLYGMLQRYYTTPVDNEKRIAKSVVKIN